LGPAKAVLNCNNTKHNQTLDKAYRPHNRSKAIFTHTPWNFADKIITHKIDMGGRPTTDLHNGLFWSVWIDYTKISV
jgi:hypothetical protein